MSSDTKASAADAAVAADAGAAKLTIEQLAAEVGMSVRNIRNHHSRGLLPAPYRLVRANAEQAPAHGRRPRFTTTTISGA